MRFLPVFFLCVLGASVVQLHAAPAAFESFSFKCHDATQTEGELDLEAFIAQKPAAASGIYIFCEYGEMCLESLRTFGETLRELGNQDNGMRTLLTRLRLTQ